MAPVVNLTSITTSTTSTTTPLPFSSTTTPFPFFSSGRFGQDLDYYPYNYKKRCWFKISGSDELSSHDDIVRILNCLFGYPYFDSRPSRPEYDTYPSYSSYGYNTYNKYNGISTTTTASQKQTNSNDEYLKFIAFKILMPIVLALIAICFVLGVILIIKSYMMAPLKQNLATAIRRRRRVGHAPDNQYVPADMLASNRFSGSDRKSLPPPEVLRAARERASQIMSA